MVEVSLLDIDPKERVTGRKQEIIAGIEDLAFLASVDNPSHVSQQQAKLALLATAEKLTNIMSGLGMGREFRNITIGNEALWQSQRNLERFR